jgi:nucleotide-binding universal stress UspA family protein
LTETKQARLSHGNAEQAEQEATARLAALAREHFPDAITGVHVFWSESPAEKIVQFADELDVDAIAMATHGRSAVAHLLAGSVAEGVIRRSKRPVIVQRPAMGQELVAAANVSAVRA